MIDWFVQKARIHAKPNFLHDISIDFLIREIRNIWMMSISLHEFKSLFSYRVDSPSLPRREFTWLHREAEWCTANVATVIILIAIHSVANQCWLLQPCVLKSPLYWEIVRIHRSHPPHSSECSSSSSSLLVFFNLSSVKPSSRPIFQDGGRPPWTRISAIAWSYTWVS
jgi:hypothetical protein